MESTSALQARLSTRQASCPGQQRRGEARHRGLREGEDALLLRDAEVPHVPEQRRPEGPVRLRAGTI